MLLWVISRLISKKYQNFSIKLFTKPLRLVVQEKQKQKFISLRLLDW